MIIQFFVFIAQQYMPEIGLMDKIIFLNNYFQQKIINGCSYKNCTRGREELGFTSKCS